MKFTIAREEEYIPKWRDNDKEDEPIMFVLRHLNSVEREGLLNISFDEDGKPRFKADNIRALRVGVKRIDNMIVNGQTISKVTEYLDLPGVHELTMEIGSKIISMNAIRSEEEAKNSP